ncbi:MAG TPA: hypothetical protein VLH59_04930, partial [Ignavibacteriaceae bacterium]|nr:hypothetical protein [Ignavibacteriaceae bacterium]
MKKLTMALSAILLFAGTLFPQVTADLTIENQQAVGTDFFFDIYLTRTGTNDVYLGTADFVLTFNSAAFTSPTILREGSSFWNLTSTSGNTVGGTYRLATSPAPITGNEIIINLNQVSFGDQSEFDDIVARINNTPSTHRVGRYRVTGINNPSAFMNLQWKTSGAGVTTQIFTLAPASPWASSQVTINAINPGSTPLPVELSSFTAAYKNSVVMLSWKTETEVNNYGFNVERRINEGGWDSIIFLEGYGNSNSPKEYSYTDKELFAGGSKFQYRLKQVDTDGQFEYSDVVEVEVLPTQFELSQNYPNPFNPSTTIRFSLPEATQVKINLFNMLGEQVATLAEGMYESGYHKITFNASS